MRSGLAIVALLGHRLEIIPGIHEPIVTVVWLAVIDDGCGMATAAFAQRMRREVGRA
jgi:hypothetical protein